MKEAWSCITQELLHMLFKNFVISNSLNGIEDDWFLRDSYDSSVGSDNAFEDLTIAESAL